ncbi:Syd protein [Streptomyces sp. NBRC 110611]|uniref:DUF397 domain-containing protein n=1 Tax=Streptomyces sp. NBRC 110611 TaxID=1621259 RepID=UPI000834F0F0|nr:DUF397 domain-containing protein [Streptomyces sp. NBRC 110611]GAU68906.1 Syd protein [Streptomyces sp. NBRC 110611]
MRTIDLSTVTWRKSSYSNQDGGACVEVADDCLADATWRKSSYSNPDGGECIEVSDDFLAAATWRKSSYSNQDGGQCVEVADNHPALVPVRDSKNPGGPALIFGAAAWSSFVKAVPHFQSA